jgi:hypothetical protein
MNAVNTNSRSQEKSLKATSGWGMLGVVIASYVGSVVLFIAGCVESGKHGSGNWGYLILLSIFGVTAASIACKGFFTQEPNWARVLLLFGNYRGTVRDSGFFWVNPFYTKQWVSLRARNFNSDKLKVNDKRGNPIEIGAVVVWRVNDSAQASFDVENYESYVSVQSESAVRHIASRYAYDQADDGEVTLQSSNEEVLQAMKAELQERLSKAGVEVEEARITHLAYAPEIAQAMLRRQQAEAVIAARTKIVHGAVSMVEMALKELSAKNVVQFDDERKAAMVSNLLVVLCGESEVTPVVNTGTLYH